MGKNPDPAGTVLATSHEADVTTAFCGENITMIRWVPVPLLALALAPSYGQDDAEARKARRARISELRKRLSTGSESEKLAAIEELGGIYDKDARSLLAARLGAGTEAVRLAAVKAIMRQRHPYSARAIAAAIQANLNSPSVLRAFIEALQALDVCASIPGLVSLIEVNDHQMAESALKAIGKIGCPEAAPGLIHILEETEAEARKPDRVPYRTRSRYRRGRYGRRRVRYATNRAKDQKLARLAGTVRETLSQITGQSFSTAEEWRGWLERGGSEYKLVRVYLCEDTMQTYKVSPGDSNKCPYSDKRGHKDIFLKHRRG